MILRGSPQREDGAGKADKSQTAGHLNVRLKTPGTILIQQEHEGLLKERRAKASFTKAHQGQEQQRESEIGQEATTEVQRLLHEAGGQNAELTQKEEP